MYPIHSDIAISGVLFREQNDKHLPVFYVNRMTTGAEKCYGAMGKLVLSLVYAKRKLRHYFEGHPIIVMTNQPLKAILSKLNLTGRMTKWAIELGMYNINIKPRTTKKGQVLADFVSECTTQARKGAEKEKTDDENRKEKEIWKVQIDRASNQFGVGVGITLQKGSIKLEYAVKLTFETTNNVVEHGALILAF